MARGWGDWRRLGGRGSAHQHRLGIVREYCGWPVRGEWGNSPATSWELRNTSHEHEPRATSPCGVSHGFPPTPF